ncbi:biopolymer transporter ExbD [Tautonia sp. JC769]|uniref:biopolymer transporter ExbD n=1 Tax=Tautonia sp. JC769 TaxID=3232135 RepID=UPI00345B1785
MANWDIFHTDRLEAERSLSTEAVRAAVASGAIRADDLVRPAGSSVSWARIGDTPELLPSYGQEGQPSTRPEPPKTNTKTTARPAPAGPAKPPATPPRPPSSAPPRPERPSRPESPLPPPPPPGDSEPILDASVVEDDEDDEVVELAEVADDPGPSPIDIDHGDADPDAGPDSDFDDSIPAPPLGKAPEEDRTVELPPRSAKPPRPSAPAPPPAPVPSPGPPAPPPDADAVAHAGDEDDTDAEVELELEVDSAFDVEAIPSPGLSDRHSAPIVETSSEALTGAELFGLFDPADEDEEAAAFTLAAEPRDEPEEIDLTAMVDVAFQLVLFFLVTATTLYFKTLEIPTPDPEDPDAVAQQMRTLDDLLDEYILVEIDPQGRISVDREPIDLADLTGRLRQARADTLRSGMLLMADFTTPHRNAVSAIDSANALGLQIAIAKPTAPPD